MYGTTTVNNLEIVGNIQYQNNMLTLQGLSSSTPLYTADSTNTTNSIAFGLTIVLVLLFLIAIGLMYNSMNSKKPWL